MVVLVSLGEGSLFSCDYSKIYATTMPSCSAPNCNNTSEKGYSMRVFPRDPERRAKWAANVGRENWYPSNNSYLCELHFEPSMWEKTRVDGSRKLKHDAVPTIFGLNLKKENEERRKRRKSKNNIHQCHKCHVSIHQLQSKVIRKLKNNPNASSTDNISTSVKEKESNELSKIISVTETRNSPSISCNQEELIRKNNRISMLPQKCKSTCLCNKLANRIIVLRQKLKLTRESCRKLKKENNRMIKERNKNLYMSHLKQIFTNDQICALTTTVKPRQWSDDTIVKALRLKSACGERGYEELIKQNMPLPSIRTLYKRSQELLSSEQLNELLKDRSEVSNEMKNE